MKRMSAMCPESSTFIGVARSLGPERGLRRQGGFVLVSAIFLLVVLAALGIYMLLFSTVQNTTSATDLEGSRVYWAARSGLDWATYQALDPTASAAYACASGCVMATPPCSGPTTTAPAATNLTMGTYPVTVSCTCTPYCQAGARVRVFRFTSNACNQANAGTCPNAAATGIGYVDRELTATVGAP